MPCAFSAHTQPPKKQKKVLALAKKGRLANSDAEDYFIFSRGAAPPWYRLPGFVVGRYLSMCLGMYVCMYVYVYIYIHTHRQTDTDRQTDTHTHMYTYMYVYDVYVYVHICRHT